MTDTTDPKAAEAAIINAAKAEDVLENKKPDIEIIDPEPEIFRLGGKTYELKPLPIKKLKLLYKLQNLDLEDKNEEALTLCVETISKLLNETDINFLEDNLDMGSLSEFFAKIMQLNLMAVEKKTKAIRGI